MIHPVGERQKNSADYGQCENHHHEIISAWQRYFDG